MDKERARDLKRSAGTRFFSPSLAKRQQRALSGHLVASSPPPSSSPSGSNNNNNNDRGEGDAMERWKKERAKGLRWTSSSNQENGEMGPRCNGSGGGSEGEEGYILRQPLNPSSLSNRKRVKLQGKVLEDCNAVDPAVVPRKLRSAINKRCSQSASPPLPGYKRKSQHAANGTKVSNGYFTERFKQDKLEQLDEEVTKEEEEVAETLTALASMITVSEPLKINEDRRMLEDNSETKATSASLSEASKEEDVKIVLPCNGTEVTNPSSCVEELKVEPSDREQPVGPSISQKNDNMEANETAQSESFAAPVLFNNEQAEGSTARRNGFYSANPFGTFLQHSPGNGVSHPTQLDSFSVRKPEIEPFSLGSASVEHDLQYVKQKFDNSAPYISRKETVPDLHSGLPSSIHGHLTMSSLSKAASGSCPNSTTSLGRPSSTRTDFVAEKLASASADRKRQRNRCSTHVYISHLINHHNCEKKQQPLLPISHTKAKEGSNSNLQASNETFGLKNGKMPSLPNGSLTERNMLESRTRMLHDERLLQAQQASTLSAAYAQQKQGCDFLALSSANEPKSSGNGMKPSGQLPVSYLPHHSVMPFPFPRGPYASSHYQEQFAAAAATQQVQLQLPHYISNNPLYSPNMMHAVSTKQQQQMWQAHMTHYRPPMGVPKWPQNGKQHDSSSASPSLLACAQSPPSVFPQNGGYHSPLNSQHQQHLLPPFSSSSSPLSSRAQTQQQQQQHDSSKPSSSQMQLLCNAQHL